MRLLNTKTLELEEFWDGYERTYAILSHRWSTSEASYQSLCQRLFPEGSIGWAKIQNACRQAALDSYDYIWIDTCCINKDSSSELSEAINSMFRYYENAATCYVHLADVSSQDQEVSDLEQQIKASEWFTRGWTLQELLACRFAVFYDREWNILGTKKSLSELLASVTGISKDVLAGRLLSECSVAQKMSWAANRKTTRPEDIAYCLLGIFDVNMPLLYGEGNKAFFRLQEEIIKQSDDHSIFAWPIQRKYQPGLLADSPAAYKGCEAIRPAPSRKYRTPYSMSNRGLSIKLLATPYTVDTYLVRLECYDGSVPSEGGQHRLGLFMRRLNEDDQYIRVQNDGNTFVQIQAAEWDPSPSGKHQGRKRLVRQITMNIRQSIFHSQTAFFEDRVNGFRLVSDELMLADNPALGAGFDVTSAMWDKVSCVLSARPLSSYSMIGYLDMSKMGFKVKFISLGFDFDHNPVVFLADSDGMNHKYKLRDRNGQLNFESDRQLAQWSEEEHAQFASVFERSALDDMAWSQVDKRGTALDLKLHRGLWAVKGDRIHGLDVKVGDVANLRLERSTFQGKFVWDLHLSDLKKSSKSIRNLVMGSAQKR